MNYNGYLMSKDTPVAKITNDHIIPLNDKLLPLYLVQRDDLWGFLKMRAIDNHRPNSRLLKKALRLNGSDDIKAVLSVNAITITDSYWIKEDTSHLTYDDVRFKENLFDALALHGDPNSFSLITTQSHSSKTPELTNIGSFEKCWRLIDNNWWLYKSGTSLEYFSELFIYHLGKSMRIPMSDYEYNNGYIRTRDFTSNATVNFEPAYNIVLDDEDYSFNYNKFLQFSSDIANQYVKMIYLDTLCYNMDRHTFNYGVLRDVDTGKVLSLAPLFDHNIALVSRGMLNDTSRNDLFVKLFCEFVSENNFDISILPTVTKEDIVSIYDTVSSDVCIDVPVSHISEIILNAQDKVWRMFNT